MEPLRAAARHRAALCVLAATAVACAGEGSTGGETTPAAIEVLSGNEQTGVAGEELAQPVVVRLIAANGAPVRGQIINFRVVAGGGTVFAGAAISDEEGRAQERWTLGTLAGSQQLEARAVDTRTGAAIVYGALHATAVAGPAASVLADSGDGQAAQQLSTLPLPLRVKVSDRHGNPVAGATVTFAVLTGGGAATPGTCETDPAGIASTAWTLGGALGAQTLEARVASVAAAQFSASSTVGPVRARLVVVSGGDQTGSVGQVLPRPIVVQLTDLDGAPIAGREVTFRVAAGGGSASSEIVSTTGDGTARTSWTLGLVASSQRLEARATDPISLQPVALELAATAVAAAPAAIVKVSSVDVPTRTHPVIVATARVQDVYGNGVSGVTTSFEPASGCGTTAPAIALTDGAGVASTAWTQGPWTDATYLGTETMAARAAGLAPAVFEHAVRTGEQFDGSYVGTVSPSSDSHCANAGKFSVLNGHVLIFFWDWQMAPAIRRDGSFTTTNPGNYRTTYAGTFTTDGNGGAQVTGTMSFEGAFVATCSVTWTAIRQ